MPDQQQTSAEIDQSASMQTRASLEASAAATQSDNEPAADSPSDGYGAGPLIPMPDRAPSNLLGAVGYTYRVSVARLARARVARDVRKQVQAETARLEEALRDLGHAARHSERDMPEVIAEKEALIALERMRVGLQGNIEKLDRQREQAEGHFAESSADVDARIEAATARIEEAQRQLSDQLSQQVSRRGELVQQDRRIKSLEKLRDEARAAAVRLRLADEQEEAQRQAAEKAIEIGDWLEKRAETTQQLALLQEPIEELRRTIQQTRATVQQCHRDLTLAKQELTGTQRQIDADKRRQNSEIARADREIAKQLVELGRATHRHAQPGGPFEEQLTRVARGWETVAARQDEIKQLIAESDSFDKRVHRWGVVLFAALIAVLMLTPLLLWLL